MLSSVVHDKLNFLKIAQNLPKGHDKKHMQPVSLQCPVLSIFEAKEFIELGNAVINQHITSMPIDKIKEAGIIYELACDLLFSQRDNENSYKSYRSELSCFLHWCFDVAHLSPREVSRRDMDKFVAYCQNPPKALIGYFNVAQFKYDKEHDEQTPLFVRHSAAGRGQDAGFINANLGRYQHIWAAAIACTSRCKS